MTVGVVNRVGLCFLAVAAFCVIGVSPSFVDAQTCVSQSTGPDVIVGVLGHEASQRNYNFSTVGGVDYEAFSMGTTSCNLGSVWLNWLDSLGNANHPVIGQNLFRLKNVDGVRRFEQLAQSWLKHGFCALENNACCNNCTHGGSCDHLGVFCSDPYSADRNGQQVTSQFIGPKWQANATTGVHIEPRANPPFTVNNVSRRMHIPISTLEVSNGTGGVDVTRYFGEGQYVAADDALWANKNNNASYRPVTVTGSGTAWTFQMTGTTQRQQCGIRAWADTDTTVTDPSTITKVLETDIITPENSGDSALVILAAQATNLGGGLWRYEYAMQNLNSDRCVSEFSVPVSGYLSVSHLGFSDVAYWDGDGEGNVTVDGTDWPGVVGSGAVTWTCTQTYDQNHNANALRWGTMYNFRFDCDQPPAFNAGEVDPILAQMKQFKPGAQNFSGLTIAPGSVTCLRGDMNDDTLIDGIDIARFSEILVGGSSTPREKCAGDLEAVADFVVDADDIDNFATCLLNGGGC